MLVIAVTHPDSTSRNPRSLSEGGRLQALLAARRVREKVGKRISLVAVMSSPAFRCLETAIVVARELGETTRADGTYDGRIEVSDSLAEIGAKPRTVEDLGAALGSLKVDKLPESTAVLVACHGDLANMLGGALRFASETASGGWFEVRPVISSFDFITDRVANLHFCEALVGGCWSPCKQQNDPS